MTALAGRPPSADGEKADRGRVVETAAPRVRRQRPRDAGVGLDDQIQTEIVTEAHPAGERSTMLDTWR
jgi:hypothetical protein